MLAGRVRAVVSLVLDTILMLKTVTLMTTLILFKISGGFTIRRSPQLKRINRLLPNTGYNNYNFTKYSNVTTTLIGNTSTNDVSKLVYPINNTSIVNGITSLLNLTITGARTGITIIHYGNSYRRHPHVTRCSNLRAYTTVGSYNTNRANYKFNYLNYNSYITTYRFNTVSVGPRANLPRISRRGYANYNTYTGTYPHRVVRLHGGNPGNHHICIRYIGRSGKTITGGTYDITYVKYNGYRGIYGFSTVAMRGGITCISFGGYHVYAGYISRYPANTLMGMGFPIGGGRRWS